MKEFLRSRIFGWAAFAVITIAVLAFLSLSETARSKGISGTLILQLFISGISFGSIYALVALGFAIIYKATSVVNFAQGQFLMIGAYSCFGILSNLTSTTSIPWVWAIILSLVFAIVLAMVVERLILRPMIGEPIISIIMATIGLSYVLRSIATAIWGTDPQYFSPKLFPDKTVSVAGLNLPYEYIWGFSLSITLLCLFGLFFKYSKAGIAMRATAFSNQVALSMGISVKNIFALSWCISAVVSFIGGILLANITAVSVDLGYMGLKVFPAVILGGLDSVLGAAIGGIVIGVLENLSDGVVSKLFGLQGIKEVAPFVFLVIILMIKPYGLFGTEEIERV
ncbi:branched-chain amino acid ABC transporter permease [bacterium]|nr:MAG: branched-chain amino acid ABC transporter permease [bacterium]